MGVDLKGITPKVKIGYDELNGKTLAVDTYNALYQFLSIIRGATGEPLADRQGRVTSHLTGLFYRSINMMERGIKLVYVFDGKPPDVKNTELKKRERIKEVARQKYGEALKKGELEKAKTYAQMTSKLDKEMVDDAKRLLNAMGIPWFQAPSEGEAQAAFMVAKNDLWAVASQDYDSLLFGAPRFIRNLTISGRRKLPRKNVYIEIEPEIIELKNMLSELNITREQLIDVAILLGTDFNPGIKGIGPKTALKLIKENKSLEEIIPKLKNTDSVEGLIDIRNIFLNPNVSSNYKIEWKDPNSQEIYDFLCKERDFSEERVKNAIVRMEDSINKIKTTRTLDSFFG
ncbi:MAG: flap endonuclease-1 [Candidatus Bathyarchaeota archaeon]|nr:flap endonuclease-1 [Candidatus Bathyarchaeota archaeon]